MNLWVVYSKRGEPELVARAPDCSSDCLWVRPQKLRHFGCFRCQLHRRRARLKRLGLVRKVWAERQGHTRLQRRREQLDLGGCHGRAAQHDHPAARIEHVREAIEGGDAIRNVKYIELPLDGLEKLECV